MIVISNHIVNLVMLQNKVSLRGIAGVDEAGRGPLIGPMVICGALIHHSSLLELERIGVRDSKMLTPARREMLREEIESLAERIVIRSVSAHEIDRLRKHVTMNEIEVREFAEIVKSLRPERVYLDAADVKASRFGFRIGELTGLVEKGIQIVSEHKADSKYPIVSAASIVAKVERDELIHRLHSRYGDFGSGYPTDQKTITFVRNLVQDGRKLPSIVRHSWDSVRKIVEEVHQMSLF